MPTMPSGFYSSITYHSTCYNVVVILRNRGMDPKVLAPEGFLICSSSGIKEMFGKVIFVVKSKLQYTMLDANTLTILAL